MRERKTPGRGGFPQQCPPVLECWAAITAHGDVQLEILKSFWYPVENSRRSSRVKGHICSLEGSVWQSCFSISTWQVCRGQHVWLLRGADKMSGLYAQISWAVSHFRPLYKQLRVSRPFLSIQAFFQVKQSHWPSQRKYGGKKGAKWNCLLCCVWIINKYSHLCWASSWWRTQPTIWNRHIFILFITSSHFSSDCQDWKLKDEEEKEQTFCG